MHIRSFALVALVTGFVVGGCMLAPDMVAHAKGAPNKAAQFDKISIQGPYQVAFSVGDAQPVKIDAPKEVLDATKVTVENGLLTIKLTKNINIRKAIKVTVGAPNLRSVSLSGASSLKAAGKIAGPFKANVEGASSLTAEGNLESVHASGASTVKVNGVNGSSLTIVGDGASTLAITASVGTAKIDASGASSVKPGITAKTATVTASGASSVRIAVAESLVASASGASSVKYSGSVSKVTASANGASNVSRGN